METNVLPTMGQPNPKLVAPVWHIVGVLLILSGITLLGFRMQSWSPPGGNVGEQHRSNVLLYIGVIVVEWALAYYVWRGLRRGQTRLRDLAVAAIFWIVWTIAAVLLNFLAGPSQAPSPGFLHPRGAVEIILWVMMSLTAGFCEELVFRGYLQRQFLTLTGSTVLALLAQGVVFGAAHAYQGIKNVIIITVLGVLFGLLAHWHKSLRPGMMSHAWTDILNVIPIRFP